MAQQLEHGKYQLLAALLGEIELNQLEDGVQLITLPLRKELLDCLELGEEEEGEGVGSDESLEGDFPVE